MESRSGELPKTRELRKMGCSILRHCRRRTQSEPPKNFKRDKLRKSQTSTSRSVDQLEENLRTNGIIERMDIIQNDDFNDYDNVNRNIIACDTGDEGGGDTNNSDCIVDSSNDPSIKCEMKNAEQYKSFEKYVTNNDSDNEGRQNNTCLRSKCVEDNYSKETYYLHPGDGKGQDSSTEKLGITKLMCCRKSRKNSSSSSYKNNNSYPYALEQYLRIPNSSVASTADSQSTRVSSLSTEGSSCPTISSSNRSRNFSSENSSANLSHDSGFDEPKCFINMIHENHRCKSYSSCHKKDKASLNIHLRNLMNCMPQSFGSDKDEPIQNVVKGCSGVTHGPAYLHKRRNAICETSDEMRVKFFKALCAFMTLQAMAKYDLL